MKHGLKNLPVLIQVEIPGAQRPQKLRQAGRVDQAGAQHRLLRLGGPGHAPAKQFLHAGYFSTTRRLTVPSIP